MSEQNPTVERAVIWPCQICSRPRICLYEFKPGMSLLTRPVGCRRCGDAISETGAATRAPGQCRAAVWSAIGQRSWEGVTPYRFARPMRRSWIPLGAGWSRRWSWSPGYLASSKSPRGNGKRWQGGLRPGCVSRTLSKTAGS